MARSLFVFGLVVVHHGPKEEQQAALSRIPRNGMDATFFAQNSLR